MRKYIALSVIPAAILGMSIPASANSTEPIYLESLESTAKLSVLATAGNTYGNWMVPGVPDGMGAYSQGGKLQVLMNHELSATGAAATASRALGDATGGSTITRFTIDPKTGAVVSAQEHLKDIIWYDYAAGLHSAVPGAPAFAPVVDPAYKTNWHGRELNRFCSAGMAAAGVLSYKSGKTTYGYTGNVFLTGEESGDESRAFAINTAGQAVQLPRLGLASWESFQVANTKAKTTVVIGGEDGSDIKSQLWMYVGTKTTKGLWFEKAGLNNGKNYVLSVAGIANDTAYRAAYPKGTTAPVTFNEVDWRNSGTNQNEFAQTWGLGFSRVEDGAFDPKNPNVYYFVTTQSNKDAKATLPNPATPTVSRDGGALWKVTFKDIKNPLAGATITMLLDGSEAPYLSKPDNIEVDVLGNVLIQEDPGSNAHRARLVAYNTKTAQVAEVLQFKKQYFEKGQAAFMTEDEESSGITDVTQFFKKSATDTSRYYILNAQIHATPATARPDVADAATKLASIIEGGQLYLLEVSDWAAIYN
ncbi:MAG: hypothetical protein RL024_680 [Actinomycetota bacterium]